MKTHRRYTGSARKLGARFMLQGYVRAVDELDLDIDVSGLNPGDEDVVAGRVRQALVDWAMRIAAAGRGGGALTDHGD